MDRSRSPMAGIAGNDGPENVSRTSSVYSTDSGSKPTYLDSRNGSSSRASTVYTPSFMSSTAMKSVETLATHSTQQQHKPSTPVSISQNDSHAPEPASVKGDLGPPPGVLLILTAGPLRPASIMSYLDMLLHRQKFSAMAFLADTAEEVALKQLKMDVFGLIGRLGKELAVSVHTQDSWSRSQIEATIETVTNHGASDLQGVLCYPGWGATAGVLDLEESDLAKSFRRTVAFTHSALRATADKLVLKAKPRDEATNGVHRRPVGGPKGPFFLLSGPDRTLAGSGTAVAKLGCDALLRELDMATRQQGLIVGYAEGVILPESKREPPPRRRELKLRPPEVHSSAHQDAAFVHGESPTKLWNMWALQNEIGFYEN